MTDGTAVAIGGGFSLLALATAVLSAWTCHRVPYACRQLFAVSYMLLVSQALSIGLEAIWHMPAVPTVLMYLGMAGYVGWRWGQRPALWSATVGAGLALQCVLEAAYRLDGHTDFTTYVLYIAASDVLFVVQLAAVVMQCAWLLATQRPRRRPFLNPS